ncbi:hypothetical protein [Oceanobacillus damuensis]|uniref:hypothetical protein n=1 Tax=Oceanobacillus damuensis TaxID=937928 RepID=UPI000831FD6D|nr:hypothetical protein [Oceanobacillus damuensis]
MVQDIHQRLQEASHQIKEAQEAIIRAQGHDRQLLEQAEQQLLQAEQALQATGEQAGSEATENSQFQQAYQKLHDTRQQVKEAQQNINDVL